MTECMDEHAIHVYASILCYCIRTASTFDINITPSHLLTCSPLLLLFPSNSATGCGVALDAISRGLKVALVERDDFASGM